jgi:carbonic anhydrase/acetyltransferase-like protein (isoleucine patch superfamily)
MSHFTSSSLRSFGGITPKLGQRVLIDPSAVVLGDVELGDDVSVWPQAAIRGDMHRIRIGCDVTIGHHATLHGCTIGDRVLVGMGATVMDGAVVEDDVVIAAGALITPGKRLRSGYLYTGCPARESRALSEGEMSYFTYSANNYVALKDRHISELEN